ncbi:MAG: CoA transferase [Dehalococcoidales bacterium]|nr:CoA transferase [Dehalococcoidales bacterium]
MSFALEGIKIVETATALAGPMASRLIADLGAEVIKIEHPVTGNNDRAQDAIAVGGRRIASNIEYMAENQNRNKRGMTIDLSKEAGKQIILKLLGKADVFVSSYRQRELKKFGLEYETLSQLNPRIICANLSGYGTKGPDKDAPGYETTSYFSRTGMMHVLQEPGAPPLNTPLGLGDNVAGLCLAYAIMSALYIRERTGVGQEVNTSLFSTGIFAISVDIAGALVTGQDRRPSGREDVVNTLLQFYQTKDGRWLRLGVAKPDLYWSRICKAIGREGLEHDPRFESFEPRIKNHVALFHIIEEEFLSKTLEEWKRRLDEAGIPWGPIQSLPEVINDPQARANDLFVPFAHPAYGNIEVVANPAKFSRTPTVVTKPAPLFNQHTEAILKEYGYTRKEIAQFREQGVIA